MTSLDLVRRSFYCDGHADTFRYLTLHGGRFADEKNGCQLSLPGLEAAHQNLQIMAIYTTYEERGSASTVTALKILQNALAQLDELGERSGLVLTRRDLNRCRQRRQPCVVLSLEGADPLAGTLELLHVFHRLGLRAIGLTHNHNSVAAGGCAPPDKEVLGLTPFGRQLIPAMNSLGMLIDTAHLGRRAFDEVLELSQAPVVNSHSCCRTFVDLERNLDDRQLRDLAASGGLAAVTYVPKFLTQEQRQATSQDVFRHLEHMLEIAGEDHVGLGSDFDGVDQLPVDLGDARATPTLVDRMMESGWGEVTIAKVLGLNWLGVLEKVLPA